MLKGDLGMMNMKTHLAVSCEDGFMPDDTCAALVTTGCSKTEITPTSFRTVRQVTDDNRALRV